MHGERLLEVAIPVIRLLVLIANQDPIQPTTPNGPGKVGLEQI